MKAISQLRLMFSAVHVGADCESLGDGGWPAKRSSLERHSSGDGFLHPPVLSHRVSVTTSIRVYPRIPFLSQRALTTDKCFNPVTKRF